MIQRVDFSANSPIYDKRHGTVLPDNVARALTGHIAPASRILDIGAGTGRVGVALAGIGFDVIAIDPSLAMLRGLRKKAGALPIRCIAAEGGRLPVRNRTADAVIVARLLYLVSDWRSLLEAAASVVTNHGLIIHEWGNGTAAEDWVQVREKARSLFEEAGALNPFHPGVRTELEVDRYIAELGFRRMDRVAAGPGPMTSVSEFLAKIESGEVSYIWNVPRAIQEACLPRLRAWTEKRFDVSRRMPMPAELEWSVFKRTG